MGLISRVSSRTYRKPVFTLQPNTQKWLKVVSTSAESSPDSEEASSSSTRTRPSSSSKASTTKRAASGTSASASLVYKSEKNLKVVNGEKTRSRVIWGKIMRPHGHSGNVRVKFNKNMPCTARGKKVRVMLY